MSSQDGAEIVALYSSIFIGNCCGIGGSVFLIYEYIISAGDGVKLFGTSRLTGASILYLTNIVIPFITNAMALIGFTRMSDKVRCIHLFAMLTLMTRAEASSHAHAFHFLDHESLNPNHTSCAMFAQANATFGYLQYIPWATFSALRAYALSEHLPLAILTLVLAMFPFGVNLVQFGFGLTGVNDPTFGCSTGVNLPLGLSKKLTIVSRTCLISADALVLAVTWYTMPRRYYNASRDEAPTFAAILLRNGTIYFASLLILNALHLTFTLVAIDLAFENVSYMTMFTEPVSAVLVSRFLLDLQAANRTVLRLDSQDLSHGETPQGFPTGSLVFNRVVGSLGSSIIPGSFEESDIEDELSATPPCDSDGENGKERSSEPYVDVLEVL